MAIKSYFTKNKKFFCKKFGIKIFIYNFAHYLVYCKSATDACNTKRNIFK